MVRAMIVPRYWAEARRKAEGARRVSVRRFGFSDASQEAAQAHAEERARVALEKILAGETLPRRELKRAYAGSDGLPIREEIVETHGDLVMTRNSYGATTRHVA